MNEHPAEGIVEQIVELARADDSGCAQLLSTFSDPELLGEVMVAVHRTGTAAARQALVPLLEQPFARGRWQGFKRIYKLAEAERDAELWTLLTHVVDQCVYGSGPVSQRTCRYLQRRAYRTLKTLAQEDRPRFLEFAGGLLRRARTITPVVERLLRLERFDADVAVEARFQAAIENPFRIVDEDPDDALAILALDAEALVADTLAEATPLLPEAELTPRWPGPIFSEVWVEDPAWLLALLCELRQEDVARALVRLLRERVGDRLNAQPLDAFYALLAHPVSEVWRLGLSQLAARARQDLLRFDELVPLFERAVGRRPAWDVIADLLFVLDDERASVAREGLGETLIDLARAHVDAPEVGPVVAFLRRHFADQIGPPLFQAVAALDLLAAGRPDVRGLGRDALARVCEVSELQAGQVARLLRTPAVEEAPDFVEGLLSRPAYQPPGPRFTLAEVSTAASDLPPAAFALLRRVLLRFEHDPGLDSRVCEELSRAPSRRARSLGLELYGGALRAGRRQLTDLVGLLRSPHEDVIVWARERITEAAAQGRLPNEALYRMLDASLADMRGFARELVGEHLRRFEQAELIVFCAESPDAATADLGIQLYKDELAGREGYDLASLLPMFRILLYQVARARPEKERLYGLLRSWALEAPANAQLCVDVVGAFRRSTCRLDLTRALTLLVAVHERYGDAVRLPFAVTETFGATL